MSLSGIFRRLPTMQKPFAHAMAPVMQKRNIIINNRITLQTFERNPSDTRPALMLFQQHVPPTVLKHVGPEGSRILDKARFSLRLQPTADGAVFQVQDLQYVSLRGGDQMDFFFVDKSVTQIDGALRRLGIFNVKFEMETRDIINYAQYAEHVVYHVMNLQRTFS